MKGWLSLRQHLLLQPRGASLEFIWGEVPENHLEKKGSVLDPDFDPETQTSYSSYDES
jgi:hypothetical protein